MKNCFIDNKPNYKYDILLDGLKIATGKLMNQFQKADIAKRNTKKLISTEGRLQTILTTSDQEMLIDFVFNALESWLFPRLITKLNIALIELEVLILMVAQIQKALAGSVSLVILNEKN